jgi:hypothetical protein
MSSMSESLKTVAYRFLGDSRKCNMTVCPYVVFTLSAFTIGYALLMIMLLIRITVIGEGSLFFALVVSFVFVFYVVFVFSILL